MTGAEQHKSSGNLASGAVDCPASMIVGSHTVLWDHARLLGLKAIGWCLRRRPRRSISTGRLRILVIRPDHLGDMLFATPALRLLRDRYPGAHLTALVGPWAVPVLDHGPPLDEILTCNFPWFDRKPRPSPWQPYRLLFSEAKRLQAKQYDIALNLRFDFWWGAMLAGAAGVPVRLGYAIPGCLPFLSEAEPYQPGRHEVEQNLGLVEALASLLPPEAEGTPGGLEFRTTPSEEVEVARLLGSVGLEPDAALVAVHPGAGAVAKLWTVEGFASVCDELATRHRAQVILTGSAQERDLVHQVQAKATSRPISLAGQTDLGQLAAVFRRCRLAIGVDSGAMHLAVAVGTPTVHLYGPSDPVTFGPYGDPRHHQVVTSAIRCSPCGRFLGFEQPAPCMRAITVAQVMEAVERVLEASATRSIERTLSSTALGGELDSSRRSE